MPRFYLFCTLTLISLLISGCHNDRSPRHALFAPVPANVLPSPNAFDIYEKAGAALRDKDKITTSFGTGSTVSPVAQEHLVRENAPALALLRKGFALPYMNPAQRSETEIYFYYGADRALSRLLRLEGQLKAKRGDWNGAVGSGLDIVYLGQDIPRGGTLFGMLVGVACQSIGRRDLWDDAAHLDALQAKDAAHRIETISSRHVPFSDVMQQEEWFGQSALQNLFHSPDWRAIAAAEIDANQENETKAFRAYIRLRLALTSEHTIYDNYTDYMDQIIRDSSKPYAAKLPLPPEPTDPLNQIYLPVVDKARLRDADNQAQNALLTTTIALQAYQLKQGRLPDTALIPAYLSHVPDDPFALSGPVRYRRTGQTYVLYSVGPDGNDDGGKAILDSTKPAPTVQGASDRRRFVFQDSKGDIVAGINRF